MISADKVGWKDDVAITTEFSEAVEDSWDGLFLKAQLTAAGGQFEFNPTAKQIVRQVSYFASIDYNVRVEDANGWRWWYMLPATTARNTLTLSANGWRLSGYQPGHADTDSKPSAPVWGDGSTEILFLPDDSDIAEGVFKLYAINNPPSTYTTDDGYTMLFTLKATFEAEGTLRVGDCTIVNQRLDPLPYTPGIIPFSNNYIPNAPTFDSWRGQPYPGYQHPWVFLDMDVSAERRDLMIHNVVNFWYDSQQWYYQKFGVLGPGASAYVWDRWDAPSGSKVNDFTMYHFGDQTAWSGYQPRAFFSAVRLYAGLLDRGLAVPEKLTTYISHWIDFLFTYQQENAYQSPTDFPMDKPPAFIPNDFTGHMAGLWLAGASLAMLFNLGSINDPNIQEWDVSRITNMYKTFVGCWELNLDFSKWNVSQVTNMSYMFSSCTKFVGKGLDKWDVSNVRNMGYMFNNCDVLDGDKVVNWKTDSLVDASGMFSSAPFNSDISGWNTSKLQDVAWMFAFNKAFNRDISGWDTRSLRKIDYMMRENTAFNQDLSGWDVSNVTSGKDNVGQGATNWPRERWPGYVAA